MDFPKIYSASGLMELIGEIGFLPLLDSGIDGFSADAIVDEDCDYVKFPDGGWDWPLWKWKGSIVNDMPCMYGKFFNKKAGFISGDWWQDFCNYRRSKMPRPGSNTIEGAYWRRCKPLAASSPVSCVRPADSMAQECEVSLMLT